MDTGIPPGWYQMPGGPVGRVGWWNGQSWEARAPEPTQGNLTNRSRGRTPLLAYRFSALEITGLVAVGVAVLAGFAAYSMQGSFSSWSNFVLATLLLIVAVLVYFVPGITASTAKHKNSSAIWALNFLLGWTVLGWVGAFIWALTADSRPGTGG